MIPSGPYITVTDQRVSDRVPIDRTVSAVGLVATDDPMLANVHLSSGGYAEVGTHEIILFHKYSFCEEFIFYRLWLDSVISLGNINANHNHEFVIWSTYRTNEVLAEVAIDTPAGTGMFEPIPLVIKPTEVKALNIKVEAEGPAFVDTNYRFILLSGEEDDVAVRGYRSVPFLWEHNWANGLKETFTWKTVMSITYDGTEQRASLMPLPRREFAMELLLSGVDAELVGSLLVGRKTNYYTVPSWFNIGFITADANTGDFEVFTDTTNRDYQVGSSVFIFTDPNNYDLSSVTEVLSDRVKIFPGLTSDYAIGAYVAPAKPFQLKGDVSIASITDIDKSFTFSMEAIESSSTFDLEYTPLIHNGTEVFPLDHAFDSMTDRVVRKWQYFDNGISVPEFLQEAVDSKHTYPVTVVFSTRVDLSIFIQFIHAIRGMALPFYMDSMANDLELFSPVASGDSELVIKYCGYTDLAKGDSTKSNIIVRLKDGTQSLHEITDSVFDTAVTDREVLSIYPDMGSSFQTSDVAKISYLRYVRMGSDTVALEWVTEGKLSCKFNVVSL